MANVFQADLAITSPYINTAVFVKDGRAFYGIWNPPLVELDGDESEYTIQQGQEGQLDTVSVNFYGIRDFWRIIAHANKIDRVFEQVVPGLTIKIPKLSKIQAALESRIRETRLS